METYRISEKEIKGLKCLEIGYKIFNNDWSSKNGYCYADKNGEVLGTIHKVSGEISECKWGLHFSKEPQDCFNFYEPLQWNKFAKVEAYGDIKKGDKKCVAQILKIVEIYSFDDFITVIQKHLDNSSIMGGNDIWGGNKMWRYFKMYFLL